jgi:hypothetical protein
MRGYSNIVRGALVLLAALSIGACDRYNRSDPLAPSGSGAPGNDTTLLQSPVTDRAGAKSDSMATKRIGPGGGTLHLSNIIAVKIPQGALGAEADITIRMLDSERVLFSITPEDLRLATPVEITVDHLDRTDNQRFSGLSIYRQNLSAWNQLPSGRNKNKIQGLSAVLGVFSVARNGELLGKSEFLTADIESIDMLRWLSGPNHETKLIETAKGGDVQVGRFKVKIPKNALAEDTFITVRDPANGYLMCELEPHGIEFLVPVELEMNVSDLALGDYTDWTIFWLNQESGYWEDQGASFSLLHDKLTADLMHFSRYAGGRAGW